MSKINAQGIALIKGFENLELEAYPDPGTGGAPWTIGYGDTGPDVQPGLTITESEAEERLAAKLEHFENAVAEMLEVEPTGNQFSALVSFAYNCGAHNLAGSTLLRLFNAGNTLAAANEFKRWARAGGRVLNGLVRRRDAERALFLTPGDGDAP